MSIGNPYPDEPTEDEKLSALLDRLIDAGPAKPAAKLTLPEILRSWMPSDKGGEVAGAQIVGRHPALLDTRLRSVPEMDLKRPSRSVTRGRQGFFHSRKNERTLHFRAKLEFNLMRLCEVDPNVINFVEQPIRLRYTDSAGKIRHHTPDLYVRCVETSGFYEVKWEVDAAKSENELRWPPIGKSLSALGFTYEVVTDRHLLRQPRLSNVETIFRSRRVAVPDSYIVADIRAAIQDGTTTLSDLLKSFPSIGRGGIFQLILRGLVSIDLDSPLCDDSIVRNMEVPYEALSL